MLNFAFVSSIPFGTDLLVLAKLHPWKRSKRRDLHFVLGLIIFNYYGSAYFYVNSVFSAIYRKYSEQGNTIMYQMQSNCLPMVDTVHYILISNVTMTLPLNNVLYDKIAPTVWQVYSEVYRHHSITMSKIIP